MRMLVWLALAVAVLYAIHRLKQPRLDRKPPKAGRPDPARPSAELEPVLPCAVCGVHLPASEAVTDPASGHAFCSPEHRRRFLDGAG